MNNSPARQADRPRRRSGGTLGMASGCVDRAKDEAGSFTFSARDVRRGGSVSSLNQILGVELTKRWLPVAQARATARHARFALQRVTRRQNTSRAGLPGSRHYSCCKRAQAGASITAGRAPCPQRSYNPTRHSPNSGCGGGGVRLAPAARHSSPRLTGKAETGRRISQPSHDLEWRPMPIPDRMALGGLAQAKKQNHLEALVVGPGCVDVKHLMREGGRSDSSWHFMASGHGPGWALAEASF